MTHTNDERYEFLTECVGINEGGLSMLLSINGETKETYNDALFYYTGERDIDMAIDEENEDEED